MKKEMNEKYMDSITPSLPCSQKNIDNETNEIIIYYISSYY